MNKRIVLIIVLSLLFVFWLLCVGFPRHMGNSYSSVKAFELSTGRHFYDFYAPEYDGGIPWNDKNINIQWPIEGLDILLSEKDKNHKPLKEQDLPFVYEK